ncbi:phosphopantothenoylcysteine decarboxylase / phosphopantothenate--cysteine ligase [Thermoanaerobacter uzonensis DSM 18761]|jgi:phosphopantothenoylcysteine decarboxylase/phosphopantothenate--cysteine ligase|uniref:Coenzyme A biosynthesis bifunctional protein CoaBC n=1 Tax=Thermoanaerobacter uzonensis DSM 18761 TaxID=1123369 RepID=A0A1M4UJQ1_9THEO|nr:bifunctional phosphopantothenoylcysteine decarboxylase/phosphopantothenate--cysteine ligase CoaBC [Thermoanaerobacter uzonensis]SHE56966.1 phosphopantothenoylcysteine decarboxylase / phosphopantothenate--cysteine ligase [Thermoanaerobacter uzonensis DSM 18761]
MNTSKKNVVLGVTGGIAAYKAADLTSRLVKKDINVDVIMTKEATNFISPLTFEALTNNKVVVDMFADRKYWEIEHISLAKKADVFAIVPATANIIAKIAHGIADDMLTTTILATKSPVLIAPAMNTNMYTNPVTQKNIKILKEYGFLFVEPAAGRLACGTYGAGRLADVEEIEKAILELLDNEKKRDFEGKKVLVTAGPTREPLDPVRYITNRSSGKMGYEIAKALVERGAQVILISGPTYIEVPKDVTFIPVETAVDMYNAVMMHLNEVDIVIGAAAVSDYKPKEIKKEKIKKDDEKLTIELVKNPDIMYEVGQKKGNKILIGFAAETTNLVEYAQRKLKEKNMDLIVANDVTQKGAGFEVDTNIIKIIDRNLNVKEYPLMTKIEASHVILDEIAKLL